MGVGFRGNRARRAGVLGKAVRAMEKNADAEKAGPENEAADTKNQPICFTSNASKPSPDRRKSAGITLMTTL
jgi:hypothetical protein